MAGTMDDLFCEYEQISKAKLRAKKRRLHGGDDAEADSEDDEAAPAENPEGAEAEALKMATDAGNGDDNKGGESRKEKKKEKEKSLNPDEFMRTTNLGRSEGEGGGEVGGEDCGIDDEEDGEVRSV